jgi:5-methylcytosine-specific restriction endonuclease McrA
MGEVLVLSAAWAPVARVEWQRAVTLLCAKQVEVVEHYEDWTVRSPSVEWKVPSIVRFLRVRARGRRAVKFSRENVWLRDGGRCQYCAQKVALDDFSYDHVVPRAQGGVTRWENVVTSCVPCNQKKGGRTPEQARMRLVAQPARPRKLPGARLHLTWRPGMPEAWRSYLRDTLYWRDELQA